LGTVLFSQKLNELTDDKKEPSPIRHISDFGKYFSILLAKIKKIFQFWQVIFSLLCLLIGVYKFSAQHGELEMVLLRHLLIRLTFNKKEASPIRHFSDFGKY